MQSRYSFSTVISSAESAAPSPDPVPVPPVTSCGVLGAPHSGRARRGIANCNRVDNISFRARVNCIILTQELLVVEGGARSPTPGNQCVGRPTALGANTYEAVGSDAKIPLSRSNTASLR